MHRRAPLLTPYGQPVTRSTSASGDPGAGRGWRPERLGRRGRKETDERREPTAGAERARRRAMSDGRGEPGERPGLGEPADWVPPAGLDRAAEPHPADPQVRPYPAGPPGAPGAPEPSGVFWPLREEYTIRPPAGRDRLWPRQTEIRWAVVVVIGLALLGIAAGGLWIAVAPRLPFQVVKAGQAVRLEPESEVFVADDG